MIDAVLQNWSGLLIPFGVCAVMCTAVEYVASPPDRSLLSRARGAAFWSIFLLVSALGIVAAQQALRTIGLPPLLQFDLSHGGEGWLRRLLLVPLALLPALLFDLAYYWFHRLQHAVPFLWRLHAVHHAIEDLNGTNCYHHWSEGIIRPVLILIPLALLIDLRVPEVMIVSFLTAIWGQAVHLKANIGFGPLGWLFVSPNFHRIHHSRDRRHYDKNFAGMFSILDVAFGTAHFPAKGEQRIDTGLNDKFEATTLAQYLIALRARR